MSNKYFELLEIKLQIKCDQSCSYYRVLRVGLGLEINSFGEDYTKYSEKCTKPKKSNKPFEDCSDPWIYIIFFQ